MNDIRNSSRLIMILMVVMSCAMSCKSKKKAMEAQAAAEKAKMEQQEAALRKQQQEEQRKKEAEAQAKLDAEARERERQANATASAPAARLSKYFDAISNAGSPTSANASISEALSLFSSPDTPLLIVISEENGQKDYDRPTTIQKYLNYLKDQKKKADKVSNLQFDVSGKITELELRKN